MTNESIIRGILDLYEACNPDPVGRVGRDSLRLGMSSCYSVS